MCKELQLALYLMMETAPSFNFLIEYAGKPTDCRVIMKPQSYDVLFDNRWMAAIAYTEDWTWIQESGVSLSDAILEEIGLRVESEYN